MSINYIAARSLLDEIFLQVEKELLNGSTPIVDGSVQSACDKIFASPTQAYREVLLGCLIARIQDRDVNIRQPYIDQGSHAFSGRSLDERVVNPFLHDNRIPGSRGPYLSVFRRSVQFDNSTRAGLRDKDGYDALLTVIAYIESTSEDAKLLELLRYILYRFIELREEAEISLSRIQRISLEQYDALISGLLATPSGGRFPVLLVVATFKAIKSFFNLDWEITWQGINVADRASGAGGDITVKRNNEVMMAAEVTERPVDRSRIVTTFNTKIAPSGLEDYLFFVKLSGVDSEAKKQVRQYFAQGHEVNFLEIKDWIINCLATIGSRGRAVFNKELLNLLDAPDIPRTLKVAWNSQIDGITRS
jgi:hypothetical protein